MPDAADIDNTPQSVGTVSRDRVRIAKITAIITGLAGIFLALLTPLLPVTQTTADLNWPQQNKLQSVLAPLISYVPVDLQISIPCPAIDDLTQQGQTVLVSTLPKEAEKAVARGLFIRKAGQATDALDRQVVEVVVRNTPVAYATLAQIRSQDCQRIDVTATFESVRAEFVGMSDSEGEPLIGEITNGDQRPQLTGIYTDLTGSADTLPQLTAHATIDDRYTTAPTVLKWMAIAIGVVLTVISLGALAVLDGTDGRRHRRFLPQNWWRFNARDAVVIGGLVIWHIVGINTSDDGYILTMSRVAEHAGYTANYYRWYGAPEAPFGWYYQIFGWLAHVTTASPWMRIPALVCGILVWLIISHEVLPRLGRAATTNRIVPWTAAFVFMASWFPFNNGLRPEPIICLGALLTWCSVERAIATGRILPAAVACTIGAFSLAAGPTGLMAVAALIAGARPMVMALIKRAKVIGGGPRSYLALLAPVGAAGVSVIFVVFSDLTLAAFTQSTRMKTALGPSLKWFNEFDRYTALFEFSANGSIGRRFAVLAMLVGLVVSGAMLIRKSRIPGTALGPARRIVGITFASLIFLMFTPTKWTHQFGVFAGLAAALAAIAAIAVSSEAMHARRNRMLFIALVLFITGLSFTAPNASFYVSNWGMPWGALPVRMGVALGTLLLYLCVVALLAAFWFHFREPFEHSATSSTSGTPRPGRRWVGTLAASPLAVAGVFVVVFLLITSVASGVKQSGSFSIPSSNVDALTGDICAMADKVLVEPDPTADLLEPVDGNIVGGLVGTQAPGAVPPATSGFTPNGLPLTLNSSASAASLGVLGGNVATSPDVLNSNAGGTGGGEADVTGINGSNAKLPFGLDATKTPVLGSYSENDQFPSYLTSSWYRLPPRSPDTPLVTMAVAGEFDIEHLTMEYSTGSGTSDEDFEVAGEVDMIDPGPRPSWRDLRTYRSSFPAEATAIRIVAEDENLAQDSFIAVTPPRTPHLQTLQTMVGSTDPVQIDWTNGLAFPCQRPFGHKYGVAEIPQWRIAPGADLLAAVGAWSDAFGGGPLGWIEVALDQTTVPSYLEGDIGRDWGSLVKYQPYGEPADVAELDLGTATRSGLWSPAPIRH
ncbi:arabinosyltransferase domain-containing protein [Nocardia sp. 348MFTsu5.1]|uniref:arabinosyltransferase domain-containing protein n=1 Tax=Nocardia sp. 348MFTsu5.1 TaxID=1172185 RepID=UPI0003804538